MAKKLLASAGFAVLLLGHLQACSSSTENGAAATGGAAETGGTAVGGAVGSGGASGQGGFVVGGQSGGGGPTDAATAGTGGVGRTGGATSRGGASGTGGAARTGGTMGTASGGIPGIDGGAGTGGSSVIGATGGAMRSGGTTGTAGARTGGALGTGGGTGSGGATGREPYKGVANSPKDQLAALGATWCYNWGTTPKATDCTDPLFVPMIWGKDNVASAIKSVGNAGYKVVLGFNEPNKSDQANMTVDEAVALWPTLTSNPDIRVGSPAVSDDGRSWLVSFMTQVKSKGLRVDFIAMHWYGWNSGSCTASQLEGAINWASQWSLPIWITEFGCMGSSNPDDQTLLKFFADAIPMLKKHPLVERYAWYPWNDHNHLYLADASNVPAMTELGKAFAAAPQYR